MVLSTVCSNFPSTFDLVGKCQFCASNESTGNWHMDYVTSTAFHALCSDTCWRHSPIDALLQFKTKKNIFRNAKCKVTFGAECI